MAAALAIKPSLCIMEACARGLLQDSEKEKLYNNAGKHDTQELPAPSLASHNRSGTPFVDCHKKRFCMNKPATPARTHKVMKILSSPKTKSEKLLKKLESVAIRRDNTLKTRVDTIQK